MDDLNRTEPPARFAIIDSQFRLHLAAYIAGLSTWATFYQAQDQGGVDRTQNTFGIDIQWLNAVAGDVFLSHQATVATYDASVRAGSQNLNACAFCQVLINQNRFSCTGGQTATCQTDLEYASLTVGNFEGALVKISAPDALTTEDSRLQSDLARADEALLTMAAASASSDQSKFDGGQASFRQAVTAINVDVTRILG